MTSREHDRRHIIAGWLWWATFRAGVARGFGLVNSYSIAVNACDRFTPRGLG